MSDDSSLTTASVALGIADLIPDGGLVVSCQAQPGSPLRRPDLMAVMAAAAADGGACAIRANGPDDVAAIRAAVDLPIIGIFKIGDPHGVSITPDISAAQAVVAAGADIVALDGTNRPRPDGRSLPDLLAAIHDDLGVPVMADVDGVEAGRAARRAGADAVATTLSGYTGGPVPEGADLALIGALTRSVDCPVVAEGRIRTREDVAAARAAGAHAVVVGTAITNPTAITRWLAAALTQLTIGSPA